MATFDNKYALWQTRLLDLSKRNRLLYFKEYKRSSVRITEPSADSIFQVLVQEQRKLTFAQKPPEQYSLDLENPTASLNDSIGRPRLATPLKAGEIRTNLSDESLQVTLYNLRTRMRSALEEQGIHILFAAFGMLHWYETAQSSEEISTPLILVPIELDRPSVTRPYTIEMAEDDVILNPTLSYTLQNDFRLTLPTLPDDWNTVSLASVLEQVNQALQGQPRWRIVPEIVIGLFSFEKLVMLKDLAARVEQAKMHPLVSALGGNFSLLQHPAADLPRADELDAKLKPQDTFQILDADSSQQEAIEHGKRGVSLVIQGPPGTGKSQTIANLIAEFLAQNKRILFVSEKQAALQVVYERLAKTGLDEFCLKAHGHKSNKNDILAQLERALQNGQATNRTGIQDLQTLGDLRQTLNAYVAALHTPATKLEYTAFYVHGLLANLENAPNLNFPIPAIADIDRVRFGEMHDTVQELAAVAGAWQNHSTHPWKDTPLQQFSFQLKSDVQFQLTEASDAASKLLTVTAQLAVVFGLPRPENLNQIHEFQRIASTAVDSPRPLMDWFGATPLKDVRANIEQAQQTFTDYASLSEKLFANVSPDLLNFPDLHEMRNRFEQSYNNIFRIFNSQYKQDLQRIQATLRMPRKLRYGEARTYVEMADKLNGIKELIAKQEAGWRTTLGYFYRGNETYWDTVRQAVDWTESCRRLFTSIPITRPFCEAVCLAPERLHNAKPLVVHMTAQEERLRKALAVLETMLPPEKMHFATGGIEQTDLTTMRQRLLGQLNEIDRLEEWLHFEATKNRLNRLGLGMLIDNVILTQPSPNQLSAAFEKRFFHAWLDAVYAQYPILQVKPEERVRRIEQFRALDVKQLSIARNRVQTQLRARRPDINLSNARTSELAVLRKELQRRRHRPIRRVFSEIPNLLLALTPCLMMSPLSVSMFLSGAEFEFDVVIFDEASQVVPEDSIASILRAKQMIVAGDSNQLPPTSFFKSLGVDSDSEDEDADNEVLESILQECSSFLPQVYLKWHYRSRHESLIAFSNYNIYRNELVTFPSAYHSAPYLGIEFIHVADGVYDRSKSRKNRVEAKRIADLVFEHFARYPSLSLGVVAFSEAQKQAIEEELERKVRVTLEFEKYLDPKGPCEFFVKNLENVQGDERDVMFFSIGYGRDAVGGISMNFGPLNGDNGARRLNVAITRARFHVKLVSSMQPEDINLANTASRGTQLLRAYLEYARSGGANSTLYKSLSLNPDAESESPFEESVYQALVQRGLVLHRQVGCSGFRIDMAVVDARQQGRYLLGIECDGATYHSAKTARDRDRLRQQVLESLGWRIHRIWSRDWIADPTYQVKRVLDALSSTTAENIAPVQSPQTRTIQFEVAAPNLGHDSTEDKNVSTANQFLIETSIYENAPLPRLGGERDFLRFRTADLHSLITLLVSKESPIELDTACRKILSCWGITRLAGPNQTKVLTAVQQLSAQQRVAIKDGFLWDPTMRVPPVRRPLEGESPRPIEQIAVEEIAQAVMLCLEQEFSLPPEDLVKHAAKMLGFSRTSERIRSRIEIAIQNLSSANRIRFRNERIELSR